MATVGSGSLRLDQALWAVLVVGREILAQIEDFRVVREKASLRGRVDLVLALVKVLLATVTLVGREGVMLVADREVPVVVLVEVEAVG
jgi:hypothetical protein